MNLKRLLLVVLGVLLIGAISIGLHSITSGRSPLSSVGPVPPEGPIPSGRANQPGASSEGSPVQQQRIDNYIAQVGKEDFETLVVNLNRHEDLFIGVGRWSGGATVRNKFAVCLANRRLAKIFAELQSRPAAEADRLCRSVFEEKFNIHKTAFIEVREIVEQGSRSKKRRPLGDNCTALHGAIFLSATFCPVSEVLRQLEEWQELGRSTQRRLEETPGVPPLAWPGLEEYAFPESVFQLNLYCWLLRERYGDGEFEQLLPKGLPTERIAFCTWDAHTNPFDFTYQVGDVDDKSVLRQLTFHRGWDFSPRGWVDERNRKLMSSLHQRLEQHATDDAD